MSSSPSSAKLIIHRGRGFYLQASNGRCATWHRDPTQAQEYSLHEAERLTLYLNEALQIQCEAVDPVLAQITRTLRFDPPDRPGADTLPPFNVDTSPRDTVTLA